MDTILIVIEKPLATLTSPWQFDVSGRLTYQGNRENDPYFSDFLESVLVDGEELNEIVLSGAVSDIVQSEWDNYYSLLWWMKGMNSSYMTEEMMNVLTDWNSVHTGITRVFRLQHVERIMRILDPPKNWEMCVLSSNDPIHMEIVGRQVMMHNDLYPAPTDDKLDESLIIASELQCSLPRALISRIISHSPPELRERVRIALYGGLRLGLLARRSGDVFPLCLDWLTILTCMDQLKIPHESIAYNTVAALCGKGDMKLGTIPAGSIIGMNASKAVIHPYMSVYHLLDLYHAILPSYTKEIDPVRFGIGRMLDYKTSPPRENNLFSVVPFVHNCILQFLTHYARMVGWPLKLNERKIVTANVSLLHAFVGRVGLERIEQSLSYNEKQGYNRLTSLDYLREISHVLKYPPSRPLVSIDELETCIVKLLIFASK